MGNEICAPNCFLDHIFAQWVPDVIHIHSRNGQHSLVLLSVSISMSKLFKAYPNLTLYSSSSPVKYTFAHDYTLQSHPPRAMFPWSPDKSVPSRFTLDSRFLKITLVKFSFSHTYIIVWLLFEKAAINITSCFFSSVIVAYWKIGVSRP